jgi:glycosyltransferase involved in cell wall biosynthesis
VGGAAPLVRGVQVDEIAWSEASEVELINSFDVGVMPLPDDDWARGKCAFKLIQYMACGVPVIGSAVGANIDVVDSSCGFLAKSNDQWLSAFRQIRDDPSAAKVRGEAAREHVVANYSLRRNLPVLVELIRDAANRGH